MRKKIRYPVYTESFQFVQGCHECNFTALLVLLMVYGADLQIVQNCLKNQKSFDSFASIFEPYQKPIFQKQRVPMYFCTLCAVPILAFSGLFFYE